MKRSLITALALTALVAFMVWTTVADAQNDKPPSVKEVMKKLNHRDTALCPTLGKLLKADAPNWPEIQQDSKQFVMTVEMLTKNDPPRGDKASWNKLTGDYVADACALDDAIQREDKPASLTAHAKIA